MVLNFGENVGKKIITNIVLFYKHLIRCRSIAVMDGFRGWFNTVSILFKDL